MKLYICIYNYRLNIEPLYLYKMAQKIIVSKSDKEKKNNSSNTTPVIRKR